MSGGSGFLEAPDRFGISVRAVGVYEREMRWDMEPPPTSVSIESTLGRQLPTGKRQLDPRAGDIPQPQRSPGASPSLISSVLKAMMDFDFRVHSLDGSSPWGRSRRL